MLDKGEPVIVSLKKLMDVDLLLILQEEKHSLN